MVLFFKYQQNDTIAAIATPPGEGGVAIIRISGKEALTVANRVFSKDVMRFASHTAHYGFILNKDKEQVDDVLLLPMKGPRSYTGEDVVEIHCHGGHLITKRVLEVVLFAGARAACPGEFTFRAYLNGRLDLAQAEAVQAVISAKSTRALNAAENQLQGALSQKISHFQKELTGLAAILEAWVDFPEEGLEFTTPEQLIHDLSQVIQKMQKLHDTFNDGRRLNEGISLCLVGAPNVGKSSLMNALLDKERAIVSAIPGTTRDSIEDQLTLNGYALRLIDTAGIRETEEQIEKEGIKRTEQAIKEADLILWVIDADKGLSPAEHTLAKELPTHKTVVAWNKIDLQPKEPIDLHPFSPVKVSAKEKRGLTSLKTAIDHAIWQGEPPSKEEVLLTNVRHKEALTVSIDATYRLIDGLKNKLSPEFLTIEIRQSLNALSSIIGFDVSEEILTAIFSKFCIGK